jgi:hypothetical protein
MVKGYRVSTTLLSVRVFALVTSLVFLGLIAREAVVRHVTGPARTVASRMGTSPQSAEDALLLLQSAEGVIPRGSSVAFFKPAKRSDDALMYLVAIGQLPHHHVVWPQARPQYVIAFQAPFADPHARLVRQFQAGAVYEVTP